MKRLALAVFATVSVLLVASGPVVARPLEPVLKTPTATGTGGAAATVDLLGTRAAIDVLRAGGNAVDAAVAAAAVLGVVEPFSCGIGGGGFMTIYRAKDRSVHTIDHREAAPATMRPDSFFANGAVLPFNDARYSGLSVGVPGTVRGWQEALRRFGTKPLGTLLVPAIRAAAGGFEVDQTFADQTTANVPWFDDITSTRALYLDPDGTAPDVGTTFRNPDLARTYATLALFGPDAFYRGPIADAMVRAVAAPPVAAGADHVWRPGLLAPGDLRAYRAIERAPTRSDYRGLSIYSMGPPSSGGSTVGEALNILDALPSASWHEYLEASRYAFADRNAYVADPAYFDVPLRGLLSDGFAATRAALVTDRAATSPVAPGDPYPFEGRVAPGPAAAAPTASPVGSSTTHLTVADKWGNVVSYTFTIESTGGSGIVVPGYGFLLNNELTDFNIDSTTHPNRADGGKRPRSSMSPTIVLRGGKPVLALGSPGGATIITTVAQILFDWYGLGTPLPAALAAPRFSQRNAASTAVEPAALTLPFAADLIARGHRLTPGAEIGAATAIEFGPRGQLTAVAEPVRRGGGSAAVVRR
ncbi:gamma-glutamyltransferase [Virgisporangium aurantiacum]|uniref:Glutathione hydrolase proenzyme n=1 Tax=Virgisporangium aurantiacum TaxID=175570 RepID=A0A8J3Z5H3_9ACTN|nr:gamma-glutamyltransferase [Virgisporangium aurantiacum]GIJ55280.1 gamma-glutamyltranspeptidase [Virgisporangium aurantiacum]